MNRKQERFNRSTYNTNRKLIKEILKYQGISELKSII